MNETVSVDKAISRGQKTVYLPLIFIFIFVMLVPVYLCLEYGFPDSLIFFAIFAALLSSWLYWNLAIVRWRLWAFRKVRNVHQLQSFAMREKLFWPAGHFINKTVIWTRSQRGEWKQLEHKFLIEDVFKDDLTVPKETAVKYSKVKSVLGIVMETAIIVMVLFFPQKLPLIFRCFLGGISALMIIADSLKLINTNIQLLINDKGITTQDGIFYPWEDISGEGAIKESYGKSNRRYLVFSANGSKNKTEITQYNINARKLNNLLYIYRNRFLANQRQSSHEL